MDRTAQLKREALAGEYKLLLKTPAGVDLQQRMISLHDRLVRQAKDTSDPAEAQMYLQRAVGVDEVRSEINRLLT
jgi:hypothetical protein